MDKYETSFYDGKRDKTLGVEAKLPNAVINPYGFRGYCDGYMNRSLNVPKPIELLEEIISKLKIERSE